MFCTPSPMVIGSASDSTFFLGGQTTATDIYNFNNNKQQQKGMVEMNFPCLSARYPREEVAFSQVESLNPFLLLFFKPDVRFFSTVCRLVSGFSEASSSTRRPKTQGVFTFKTRETQHGGEHVTEFSKCRTLFGVCPHN